MNYYLTIPSEKSPISIGEDSFQFFYADHGFDMLVDMLNKNPELVTHITITDETGKILKLDEFMAVLESIKMRVRT